MFFPWLSYIVENCGFIYSGVTQLQFVDTLLNLMVIKLTYQIRMGIMTLTRFQMLKVVVVQNEMNVLLDIMLMPLDVM